MIRFIYSFIMLFMALTFVSCQSYRTVNIEMYKPASITFPPEVRTIMIIDNTVRQPDNFGHHLLGVQNQDSTVPVSTDSMSYYFCLSLGKAIAESPLFDDVRLCDDTFRRDSLFYLTRPFAIGDVKRLCDEYDVDAIVTLDKLIFNTLLYNRESNNTYGFDFLVTGIDGEMKAFWRGQNVLFSIPFTDSLTWTFDTYGPNETITTRDMEYGIRYLSENTGQKMYIHFVPFWLSDERWYYTSVISDWKRATAYAVAEKWESAANIWLPLFSTTTQKKRKAHLASNLALTQEMKGNFLKAIEYAEIAASLYKEIADGDNKFRKMQQDYLELLQKRLEDESKLSEQLREN